MSKMGKEATAIEELWIQAMWGMKCWIEEKEAKDAEYRYFEEREISQSDMVYPYIKDAVEAMEKLWGASIDPAMRVEGLPRVLTQEELRTSSGHGWEEIWYSGDEEDVEGVALQECVWINGHIMLEDGCTADANGGIFQERYGMKYGCRVWQGMPTDEMRKETPWEEE